MVIFHNNRRRKKRKPCLYNKYIKLLLSNIQSITQIGHILCESSATFLAYIYIPFVPLSWYVLIATLCLCCHPLFKSPSIHIYHTSLLTLSSFSLVSNSKCYYHLKSLIGFLLHQGWNANSKHGMRFFPTSLDFYSASSCWWFGASFYLRCSIFRCL